MHELSHPDYNTPASPDLHLPEAVAGPTAFNFDSSRMAAETSGRYSNALRLVSSTVVSLFAFTRSDNLGRNFPRYIWNELTPLITA